MQTRICNSRRVWEFANISFPGTAAVCRAVKVGELHLDALAARHLLGKLEASGCVSVNQFVGAKKTWALYGCPQVRFSIIVGS